MLTQLEMEQYEAVSSAMSEYNESLRRDLEEFERDTAVLRAVYNELSIRKRDGMMRIWDLEDELKQVHDLHLTQWSEKEVNIGDLHEKIEELTIRLELKGHVLEDIVGRLPVYENDLTDKMYCDSGFHSLQIKSNLAFDLMTDARCTAATASNLDLIEPAAAETVNDLKSIQIPTELIVSEVNIGEQQNDNEVIIRDFEHLHQLQMYLLRKSESKKFGKYLKSAQKVGFKADVLKFCENLLKAFVTDTTNLEADLGLTFLEITEEFVTISAETLKSSQLKSFKSLLTKFLKKYPVNASKKKLSFLQRLCENKEKKLARDLKDHMDFLKQKIFLEEKFSISLQKRLMAAEEKNDESRKYKSLMEGDMILLGMLLQDAQDNLRYEHESYHAQFEEQDGKISQLRQTVQDLEGNIELKDLAIQFLAAKLNPVNESSGYIKLEFEDCLAFTKTTDF